ncbi:hypothetical protein TNCV_3711131 [Trichonephila clavipes]|uniref:Uncharacterized protein n=1 Tax=Trichonephila clavipes TaxID=2585209 RepID=A0A8X6R796_TRICX|nr:hypothetical protein TNCV_3711131 [Trichonephila clavipes]
MGCKLVVNYCSPSTFLRSWYHLLLRRPIDEYQSPQVIDYVEAQNPQQLKLSFCNWLRSMRKGTSALEPMVRVLMSDDQNGSEEGGHPTGV